MDSPESARALVAARLLHCRVKLTWDPNYVASKKKTKNEKAKAIAETTLSAPPLNHESVEKQDPVPQNVNADEYPEILEGEDARKNEEIPAERPWKLCPM